MCLIVNEFVRFFSLSFVLYSLRDGQLGATLREDRVEAQENKYKIQVLKTGGMAHVELHGKIPMW